MRLLARLIPTHYKRLTAARGFGTIDSLVTSAENKIYPRLFAQAHCSEPSG
jgi:hypothetical protein